MKCFILSTMNYYLIFFHYYQLYIQFYHSYVNSLTINPCVVIFIIFVGHHGSPHPQFWGMDVNSMGINSRIYFLKYTIIIQVKMAKKNEKMVINKFYR